jgi:hypothetical protein
VNRLPQDAIDQDHSLENATDNASLALMHHRWRWTLDESNPDRVAFREYARQVNRDPKTVRQYAHGYALWVSEGTGPLTADEARERAQMGVETEAATEAVAQARGIQFGYARQEFASEARNIREQARQRAEEKGTSTLDEIPQAAAITYKRQDAERERDDARAKRTPLRYIQIEARLNDAQRALVKAIQASESVDLSPEDRELLNQTLDNIKRLVVIADRAITNAYDTSWRREFHLIEGGLAS